MVTSNLITSPITNEIISVVEKIGPITIDALYIIFPRRDLERRIRSAWGYLQRVNLQGERGVSPLLGREGYTPVSRQVAYGWYAARVLEAGLEIDAVGRVVYPRAALQVYVVPEVPEVLAGNPAIIVVPLGCTISDLPHYHGIYVVREEKLRVCDLRAAMKATVSASV